MHHTHTHTHTHIHTHTHTHTHTVSCVPQAGPYIGNVYCNLATARKEVHKQ